MWEFDDILNQHRDLINKEMSLREKEIRLHKQQAMESEELKQWMEEIKSQKPYSPPLTFEQKIDKVIGLLERFGPKLERIANVMGEMNLEEENNGS